MCVVRRVCVVSALHRARRVPCCTTVVDLYAVQQRYIARCMPGVHRMVSHVCAYDESQDSRNNELATTFHGPRPENTTLPATVPVTLTPVSAPSPARGRKRSRRPPGCASGPAAGCFKHPGQPPGVNHPGQPPGFNHPGQPPGVKHPGQPPGFKAGDTGLKTRRSLRTAA